MPVTYLFSWSMWTVATWRKKRTVNYQYGEVLCVSLPVWIIISHRAESTSCSHLTIPHFRWIFSRFSVCEMFVVFLFLKAVRWWIRAPCVSVCWRAWTVLPWLHGSRAAVMGCLHALSPWKTHCTGLNLSEEGLGSVVFAKSSQVSVRPGQLGMC